MKGPKSLQLQALLREDEARDEGQEDWKGPGADYWWSGQWPNRQRGRTLGRVGAGVHKITDGWLLRWVEKGTWRHWVRETRREEGREASDWV